MEKTIEIPEGYEARIEGNKVILELKESEDERIRKGLIEHLKELKEQSVEGSNLKRPEHYDAWIAWVEKQGSPSDEQMKLTWQDIQRIVKIADQIVDEDRGGFMGMEDEAYYKEVLARYLGTNKD